jgi:hypothetical protein
MTVGAQVRQALADAKSVQAKFEIFALQTQDEGAEKKYNHAANQLLSVIEELESRIEQIEREEPSYRMDIDTDKQKGLTQD